MKVRPVDGVIDRNALFLSKRKQRISVDSVQMIVKKYLKLAGINPSKYSPHKLRHTFATLMYREGKVDILTLKKLLGHDDISTTEIYTHLESKDLEEAVYKNPLLDSPEK
jgi:site-specific recombinase XerD